MGAGLAPGRSAGGWDAAGGGGDGGDAKVATMAARVVRHAFAITFQLTEEAVTGAMVRAVLAAIRRLRVPHPIARISCSPAMWRVSRWLTSSASGNECACRPTFSTSASTTCAKSFASLLVFGGASLEMIGQLLGHTQIGTTQRYAHLIDPPLRAGVNAVGEMLKPRLKVVGS